MIRPRRYAAPICERVLAPNEARAVAVAAFRFKAGTPEYRGCVAGFMDAFPEGESALAGLDYRDGALMRGYWVGMDLGRFAWWRERWEARYRLPAGRAS